MSRGRVGLAMLIGGLAVISAGAQELDTHTAQLRLLSHRAAQADAYRKLSAAIRGLRINADTCVGDFVAESGAIRASMDDFICSVRLGPARFFQDDLCEVPAEVTVEKVIERLQAIHARDYKGDRIKASDFEQMSRQIERKVIKVAGMGAPREDLPPELPAGVEKVIIASPEDPPIVPLPGMWRAIGPQPCLMAIDTAKLDARRQLLERIKGLRINPNTTVRDFAVESDQITAQGQGILGEAQVVSQYMHANEPIVEVTVEVPLEAVVTTIKALHSRAIRGDDIKEADIEAAVKSLKTTTFKATGFGIPPAKFLTKYNESLKPELQIPAWAIESIRAEGSCAIKADATAQDKLKAARCAELDAQRNLREHLLGLQIPSGTSVKELAAQHDEIRAHLDAQVVEAVPPAKARPSPYPCPAQLLKRLCA